MRRGRGALGCDVEEGGEAEARAGKAGMNDLLGAILICVVANLALTFYLLKRFDAFERNEWNRRNLP
jgi:hypothetical protein